MEHFDIILVLSRIALDGNDARAKQQIERLRALLEKSDAEQAAKLERLLSRAERHQAMAPLAIEEMRATAAEARRQLPGEMLSQSTPLPTDRETGAPLVRVRFPEASRDASPILGTHLSGAVDDLVQEWNHSSELGALGAKPNMRCLLYGPPGVGKTKLARYLAARLELPCVEARLDGLISSFLGTTARNIGSLFDFANRYRCVLFLDEFDAVAKARDDLQEVGEIKRVVNSLLQSLDARNGVGITVAATNHEHLLDRAVWRRFDMRVEIHLPDSDARKLLLAHFLRPIELSAPELQFLVWVTEHMSGSDIETLVDAAKRFVVLHGPSSLAPESNTSGRPPELFRTIVSGIRRQAVLNARMFFENRAELLTGNQDALDVALRHAELTQHDRAVILGLSQSTVSRRAKRSEPRRVG